MNIFTITLCSVLLVGCGTIAGNPKKPPNTSAIVLDIPSIDLEWDDDAFSTDGSSLSLRPKGSVGEKFLFNAQGRRLQKLLKELNRTARRWSQLVRDHGEQGGDQIIRFNKKGVSGLLDAKVVPITANGWAYEAVLCAGQSPTQIMRWAKDGETMEIWRDFSRTQGDGEEIQNVSSQVRVKTQSDGALEIDLASHGSWQDDTLDGEFDLGLLERVIAVRAKDTGIVSLKSIQDRFKGTPPSPAIGDTYLVGRIYPQAGKKRLDSEFVGYSMARRYPECARGFDESNDQLWTPSESTAGFCVASDRSGQDIVDFEAFKSLVASLEPVGILKANQLDKVDFPAGFSCESP